MITVPHALDFVLPTARVPLMQGIATDGSGIKRIMLEGSNPHGDPFTLEREPLTPDPAPRAAGPHAEAWQVLLPGSLPGSDSFRVLAIDQAGNRTTPGPFTVTRGEASRTYARYMEHVGR